MSDLNDDLDQRLKKLPKPNISRRKKQEMYQLIITYYDAQKRRSVRLKKIAAGATGLAFLVCLIIMVSLGIHVDKSEMETAKGGLGTGTSIQSSLASTANEKSTQSDSESFLKIPNGRVLRMNEMAKWKNIEIQLLDADIDQATASINDISFFIGNHSTIISQESTATSFGRVALVLNRRDPPAAAHSTAGAYEYWAVIRNDQRAYAICFLFSEDRNKAKNQVKQLLKGWHVPKTEASE